MENLQSLLSEVTAITEEAAALAKSYFRQAILIETKDNGTPVTIADKKTEEFIRERLQKSFPHFGVLGEEFGEELKSSEYLFTIDPIDGTRSFIKGIPLFGTLVSLLRNKEPILGVMVLPCLEETYAAARGMGAKCNGVSLRVSNNQELKSAFVSVGDIQCFDQEEKMPLLEKLQRETAVCRGYTDCFGHSLVLRGALDLMIDPVVSIWDVAPIACLVAEAGGIYCDFDGKKSITSRSFLTASSQELVEALF